MPIWAGPPDWSIIRNAMSEQEFENSPDEEAPDGDDGEIERLRFVVRRRLVGSRLDKYLQSRIPRMSRSIIQKLIKQGEVTINGRPTKASYEPDGGGTRV